MKLDQIASRLHALETVDKSEFQRHARVLQSLWRTEKGYECGEHHHQSKSRLLGSRLQMPWARPELRNFLTDRVRAVVRAEVLDPEKSRGKLFKKPRIFNDLLSSQPLCFNLFGELRFDLPLASRLVSSLTGGRFSEVVAIEFEHSPSRSDERYSDDRSAFDVFLECRTAEGARGFIGVEVKYHENLAVGAARHRPRYDEVAAAMGCFRPEALAALRRPPLQQFWRDHLLCGAVRHADEYDDAVFVVLYPRENPYCRKAIAAYRETLADSRTFDAWVLEDVVGFLIESTQAEWPRLVHERYCDFARVDHAAAELGTDKLAQEADDASLVNQWALRGAEG